MPREVFIAGQILTAAEMNTVSDQTVMSFAGTAARGSAIPSPVEGMAAYLTDSNIVSLYDGSAWKNSLSVTGGILQVVSTVKTDTFTSSVAPGASADITGLTVTITPKSASSKILVQGYVNTDMVAVDQAGSVLTVLRDSTALAIGDAAGTRQRRTTGGGLNPSDFAQSNSAFTILDSPATTSAITYKIAISTMSSLTRTVYVNRSVDDTNDVYSARTASSITVMEVAG